MRPWLIVLIAAVLISVGVDALGDLTQTRLDPNVPGTHSEVVFEVKTKGRNVNGAAKALWGVCGYPPGAVRKDVSPLASVAKHRYAVTVDPALGKYGRRRVEGCLEDGTIERVQGHVISIRDVHRP